MKGNYNSISKDYRREVYSKTNIFEDDYKLNVGKSYPHKKIKIMIKRLWRLFRIPLLLVAVLLCYIFTETMLGFTVNSLLSIAFIYILDSDFDSKESELEE